MADPEGPRRAINVEIDQMVQAFLPDSGALLLKYCMFMEPSPALYCAGGSMSPCSSFCCLCRLFCSVALPRTSQMGAWLERPTG